MSERERRIPYDVTYMWNLKYDISERETENRNGLTDRENRPVAAKGQPGRVGMDWDFAISSCKVLYIDWMNNKVYSITQETIFSIL